MGTFVAILLTIGTFIFFALSLIKLIQTIKKINEEKRKAKEEKQAVEDKQRKE